MLIPPELYRPIVQNVHTRADLYTLLFVSRDVSSEAERVLYHTIHRTSDNPMRSIQLCRQLAYCSRAARLVRELEISGHIAPRVWNKGAGMDPREIWPIIKLALRALENLRSLRIAYRLDFYSNRILREVPSDILCGCTFKLEVIILRGEMVKHLHSLDMTRIKELSIIMDADPDVLDIKTSPHAFRTLRVLSCVSSRFLSLGYHNLQQLKALELTDSTHLPWQWPTNTFPSVTSLKVFHTHTILGSFPSLRFLCMFVGNSYLESETSLSNAVGELTVLKHLEKLFLITNLGAFPDGICSKFFSRLDTLKELIILSGAQWDASGLATRWDRTGQSDVAIVDIELEWKESCWF